ncbi:DUF1330 domain-containing protein [Bradyrhizobium genosp. P]|uniref:DUF1330 domain-containing protein n=1 Tax=Bradyrhizobium genosp. P TaxID=83641 RepID=UPI003CEC586B
MFEFPTMEAIHAFWDSPDCVPIKKLREGAATAGHFPGVKANRNQEAGYRPPAEW